MLRIIAPVADTVARGEADHEALAALKNVGRALAVVLLRRRADVPGGYAGKLMVARLADHCVERLFVDHADATVKAISRRCSRPQRLTDHRVSVLVELRRCISEQIEKDMQAYCGDGKME